MDSYKRSSGHTMDFKSPPLKKNKNNNDTLLGSKGIDLMRIISAAEEEVDDDEEMKIKSMESVEEVRSAYEKGKLNNFGIQLQVCHIEIPKYKHTDKNLVHVYLSNPSNCLIPKVLNAFSDRLGCLINQKRMPKILCNTLILVTIWQTSIEECKKKFSLGNFIRVKRFTNLNTFRDMLQFNCVLDNISPVSKVV